MKKLIEKIKSYFEKITVVIPDGIEDGVLKCHYTKINKRKIKRRMKKIEKTLNKIWGNENDR
jgi:hypothetical protein